MQILLIILKQALQIAVISWLTGIIKSKFGKAKGKLQSKNFQIWPLVLSALSGAIVSALLTWNFKPENIEVVERIVDREVIVEVMPPLNCKKVELLAGIKKGESLTKLIRPYAELKAAYLACLNSIN